MLPQLRTRDPYPGFCHVLSAAWTGLHGGISLAEKNDGYPAIPLTLLAV